MTRDVAPIEDTPAVTVWILDDRSDYREKGKRAITEVLQKRKIKGQIVLFDGMQVVEGVGGEPRGHKITENDPKADFIVLDLSLGNNTDGDMIDGLRSIGQIPGVKPDRIDGPFVIIWTHFAADHDVSRFFNEAANDRIVQAPFKSVEWLSYYFDELLTGRYEDEGVDHP